MDVEIDDRHPPDAARLEHTHRDGHVVEWTESLAMIPERVVEAAAQVNDDSGIGNWEFRIWSWEFRIPNSEFRIPNRNPRRGHRAANHQPEARDHLLGPGQLEFGDLGGRQRAATEAFEVGRGVDEGEVVPGSRLRFDHLLGPDQAAVDGGGVDQPVLARGKDVRTDVDVVARRVDDDHDPGLAALRARGDGTAFRLLRGLGFLPGRQIGRAHV